MAALFVYGGRGSCNYPHRGLDCSATHQTVPMTNEQDLKELKDIVLFHTAGSVTREDVDRVFEALPKSFAKWLLGGPYRDGEFRAEANGLFIMRAKLQKPNPNGVNEEHYTVRVKMHQYFEDTLSELLGKKCVNG